MTKSLTEQWKDGKLDYGWYYIEVYWGAGYDIVFDNYNKTTGEFADFGKKQIANVLAPVPSYNEYKRLQERNEKLEKMAFHYTPEEWNTMLRKIERLEKQLARTKTKEYVVKVDWFSPDPVGFLSEKQTRKMFGDWKKKKKEVK